ncbi:MAG TPA: hypothetical protein VNH84_04955, partial [Candidatus Saccharimonadales bacterium]|nr:hypothetical protein [Candidatus Saccharimonadales bacterium]
MKIQGLTWRWGWLVGLIGLVVPAARPAEAAAQVPPPIVLTVEGTNVWIQHPRSQQRESAYPQQILEIKDHGYTGARSRATLRLSDLSVARISEQSEFEIEALPDKTSDGGFSLL